MSPAESMNSIARLALGELLRETKDPLKERFTSLDRIGLVLLATIEDRERVLYASPPALKWLELTAEEITAEWFKLAAIPELLVWKDRNAAGYAGEVIRGARGRVTMVEAIRGYGGMFDVWAGIELSDPARVAEFWPDFSDPYWQAGECDWVDSYQPMSRLDWLLVSRTRMMEEPERIELVKSLSPGIVVA